MAELRTARAVGLLGEFDAAGVLTPADVHVALRLGALTGETDERVLLAVALTVRSTRHGSVVLDLVDAPGTTTSDADDGELIDVAALPWPETTQWAMACAASPVARLRPGSAAAAVHVVGTRLWLDRYWRQEQQVADELRARVADVPDDLDPERLERDLDELFPAPDDRDQRTATSVAALARVGVIGGGPGTGKTTTIARLIAVLYRQRPALRIALAAPTGKAAARLEEAVRAAGAQLPVVDRARLDAMSAGTLHRLLGWRPDSSSRFRHDRGNHVPYDVVIVDECSMMSLTITARLLEALGPATRLVLVGDPDQLASVEAGAVLGDIVEASIAGGPLAGAVSVLRTVRRFDAGGSIARLAEHVRAGRADEVLALLDEQPEGIEFCRTDDDEAVSPAAKALVRAQAEHELSVIAAARAGDARGALDALEAHRLLCAHRSGPRGVRFWSDQLERHVFELDPAIVARIDGRYAGQPLLVRSNDYENGLYNGDTGVVIERGDELVAAFRRGAEPVLLPLVRLSDVRPLHAMTIHRAQGSQFGEVTVLLPAATSPLATRQTFYTAVTRAARHVRIIGSEAAVTACVTRPAARATGLRERLVGAPGRTSVPTPP